jgi:hypothetical protein
MQTRSQLKQQQFEAEQQQIEAKQQQIEAEQQQLQAKQQQIEAEQQQLQAKQQQIEAKQQQNQAEQQQIVNKYEEIIKKFKTITSHLSNKKYSDTKCVDIKLNLVYDHFKKTVMFLTNMVEREFNKDSKIIICLNLYEFLNMNLLNYYNVFCDNYENSKKNFIQANSFVFVAFKKTIEIETSLINFKHCGIPINETVENLLRNVIMQTRLLIMNHILPDIEKRAFDDLI